MRKIFNFVLLVLLIIPYSAYAILSMELTRGVAGAIPILIAPFNTSGEALPEDVSGIVTNDLQNSGQFKVYGKNALGSNDISTLSSDFYRHLGVDKAVTGKIRSLGGDRFQVSFQLLDTFSQSQNSNVLLNRSYIASTNELRTVAHHISDLIYQQLTGVRGVFSTKLAYVVVNRQGNQTRYILEVSDQDGYRPRSLLNSPEPIMSPAWSYDGRYLAYVSFENHRAQIFLQELRTGARRLLSNSPGINGAPAWSPDGSKLALVLSKNGSPNIYIMDVNTKSLTSITNDFYINTEPAWSPDGKTLLFTSNRSGGSPQIYQANLATREVNRVSYDGDYNARASYTKDGKSIVMIHRVSGIYSIAVLDLDTGATRVLTTSADSSSPSIAPNGSMILYDTVYGGRNVLAMVASDGRVQLRLPARSGEAQDPAWSPFLA